MTREQFQISTIKELETLGLAPQYGADEGALIHMVNPQGGKHFFQCIEKGDKAVCYVSLREPPKQYFSYISFDPSLESARMMADQLHTEVCTEYITGYLKVPNFKINGLNKTKDDFELNHAPIRKDSDIGISINVRGDKTVIIEATRYEDKRGFALDIPWINMATEYKIDKDWPDLQRCTELIELAEVSINKQGDYSLSIANDLSTYLNKLGWDTQMHMGNVYSSGDIKFNINCTGYNADNRKFVFQENPPYDQRLKLKEHLDHFRLPENKLAPVVVMKALETELELD